jgi:hypothetical protein
MTLGQIVIYEEKRYVLCGLEPMSVPNRHVLLQEPATGAIVWVPIELVTVAEAEV